MAFTNPCIHSQTPKVLSAAAKTQEAHEGRHKKSHRRRHSREQREQPPEVVTPSFGEWHDGEEQGEQQGLGF